MKPVTSFVTIEELQKLASRSNFRYGQELAKNSTITFPENKTFYVEAEVKTKSRDPEKLLLQSTSKGLKWKCSCTARKNFFCEHAVAVGIMLSKQVTRSSLKD
jgi:uncharacterized Zn finger protein